MTARAAFRGQPLLLLAFVVGGWLVVRTTVWTPPFALPGPLAERLAARPQSGAEFVMSEPPTEAKARWAPLAVTPVVSGPASSLPPLPARPAMTGPEPPPLNGPARALATSNNAPAVPGLPRAAPPPVAARLAEAASISRWSADGWLMLRQDSAAPLPAAQPSYGRSQAGAVLRYQLAPRSRYRPQAYLRASAALAGPREREIAAGFSARPVPAVPLRIAAEARVGELGAGTEVRPAVYAVSELAPQRLPLDARAEAYLQAGYVGGDRPTAFVDGLARIERRMVRRGTGEFGVGAGAWGGAQHGAARLDIGPGRGRIAADYRLRVAGDAAPASGGALTLSAGF